MFSSAEEKEATDLLQNILRCNTTNPPGNEAVLAEIIKQWLAGAALWALGMELVLTSTFVPVMNIGIGPIGRTAHLHKPQLTG